MVKQLAVLSILALGTGLALLRIPSTLTIALDESSKAGDVVFTAAFQQPARLCAFQSYSDCGLFCQVGEYQSLLVARSASGGEVVWQQRFQNTGEPMRSGEARQEVWDLRDDCMDLEAYEPFALVIGSIEHRRDGTEASIRLEGRRQ